MDLSSLDSNTDTNKDQIFYVVATPIGHRDDITTRAMQVLGDVDFIVAEDTRHSGQILAYLGIKKPLLSFRDAPTAVMERLIKTVLERVSSGQTGAYITDAGTPSISDPGWRLIDALTKQGVTVSPIPGPSAGVTLLSIVDIPLTEYRFLGFLPKKKGFQTKLEDIKTYLSHKEPRGVLFYESPNRINDVLTSITAIYPSLYAIIGRELTKKFESIYRGDLTAELIEKLPRKGEYVVLIANRRA